MAKAGIFDPWRQTPERPEHAPEPQKALRVADALEPEDEIQESCISFPGRRTRLNIWFRRPDATQQDGVATVVELLHALRDQGFEAALRAACVHTQNPPALTTIPLQDHEGNFVYVEAVGSAEAVDTVAFLLRSLTDSPAAAALIHEYGVKALVI